MQYQCLWSKNMLIIKKTKQERLIHVSTFLIVIQPVFTCFTFSLYEFKFWWAIAVNLKCFIWVNRVEQGLDISRGKEQICSCWTWKFPLCKWHPQGQLIMFKIFISNIKKIIHKTHVTDSPYGKTLIKDMCR